MDGAKEQIFPGGMSPKSRVAVAVAAQTPGFESFFCALLHHMQVEMTPGAKHWLKQFDCDRRKKTEKAKMLESEFKRMKVCDAKSSNQKLKSQETKLLLVEALQGDSDEERRN